MGKKPLKRDYLTLSEIAKVYGVTRHSVYQRLLGRKRKGKKVGARSIPYHMVGNFIVLKRKDLPKLGYQSRTQKK